MLKVLIRRWFLMIFAAMLMAVMLSCSSQKYPSRPKQKHPKNCDCPSFGYLRIQPATVII